MKAIRKFLLHQCNKRESQQYALWGFATNKAERLRDIRKVIRVWLKERDAG
ncbi:hypothetical protein [Bartonella phoceensis]|uniref:hypothetical protein n=1 Tax=Bartonella phoceensis TaxID=270249 RepID=UPI001ABBB3B3|nr:hypothetical protein [Bartonella phoceensis]